MWIVELTTNEIVLSVLLASIAVYLIVKGIQMAAKENLANSINNLETVSTNLVSAISLIPTSIESEAELQALADRVNSVAAILSAQGDKLK